MSAPRAQRLMKKLKLRKKEAQPEGPVARENREYDFLSFAWQLTERRHTQHPMTRDRADTHFLCNLN
jgi:hypothetical protein